MVRTRAQDQAATKSEDTTSAPPTESKIPQKRQEPEDEDDTNEEDEPPTKASKKGKEANQGNNSTKGNESNETNDPNEGNESNQGSESNDGNKPNEDNKPSKSNKPNTTIRTLLSTHGTLPLSDTSLTSPQKPTPETLLAHLLNATLSSTRISHTLAAKTVRTVIDAGYANLSTLEKDTWERRTEILTEGGYTHYREKTATQLGELAALLRSEYDGDLNNLLGQAKEAAGSDASHEKVRDEVRSRLKKIKGVGEVAVDVFCDTAQGVWRELAPFLDPRSQKTAEGLGLSGDAEVLFGEPEIGRHPVEMCRLASALTVVRLEGKEGEFT
ncbi:hypothetical protein PMZ80_004322 [Knufia obscura]|uniref:Uncharacterized protein n=1 Tax=Knufia obscura TaxID=1635080 RepID=A0ABR0RRS0_9EURO|nr:hypothetical protein PMZ80_004322 [Knufia obscura]